MAGAVRHPIGADVAFPAALAGITLSLVREGTIVSLVAPPLREKVTGPSTVSGDGLASTPSIHSRQLSRLGTVMVMTPVPGSTALGTR